MVMMWLIISAWSTVTSRASAGRQNHLVLEGGLGVLANLGAVLLGVVAGLSVGSVKCCSS